MQSGGVKRREFITLLGGAAAWPLAARAQQPAKIPQIGFLLTGWPQSPDTLTPIDAFRQGLRQLGYVENQNIAIEYRFAEGKIEHFSNLAVELVRLNVDLIVAGNTPAAIAARQATVTIPIVGAVMGDPIEDGLVASLAQPGGNLTGLTFLAPELTAKRLQLLKDMLPNVSRVAVLWQPGAFAERTTSDMVKATEAVARTLGVQLRLIEVRDVGQFGGAFATMASERVEALCSCFPARRSSMGDDALSSLPWRSGSPRFTPPASLSNSAALSRTVRTSTIYFGAAPSTWTRFSRGPSPPPSRWSRPLASSSSST